MNEQVFATLVVMGNVQSDTLIDSNHQLISDARNAIANLAFLDLERLGADERADALREFDQLRTRIEARFSRELRGFATIDHLRATGVSSMSGWLTACSGTTRRDAGRRATLANTLGELPLVEAAMLEGDLPIEAARIIARALNPRTRHLFDIFTQAAFVDAARVKTCDELATDIEAWIDRHDPDGAAPDDPTTDVLHANQIGDRVSLHGDLSLDTGLPILSALDEEMAKIRAHEPRDPDGTLAYRIPANRRAEALANLVERGAAAPDSTTRREPAFITIDRPTPDGRSRIELPDGTLIPTRLADRWATPADHLRLRFADPDQGITARFVDPDGNVSAELDLGRTTRYANRAQRRALVGRDRGCAFPGCDRSHHACDAHHIVWWEHNGPTDLDNLVLLCRFHHVLIHTGIFHVDMSDHHPVFRRAETAIDDLWYRHPSPSSPDDPSP